MLGVLLAASRPFQWTSVLIVNINGDTSYKIFSALLFKFNALSWGSICTDMKSLVRIPECGCTVISLTVLY